MFWKKPRPPLMDLLTLYLISPRRFAPSNRVAEGRPQTVGKEDWKMFRKTYIRRTIVRLCCLCPPGFTTALSVEKCLTLSNITRSRRVPHDFYLLACRKTQQRRVRSVIDGPHVPKTRPRTIRSIPSSSTLQASALPRVPVHPVLSLTSFFSSL